MDNVKRLWEEYLDFENGLNKITVRMRPIGFKHPVKYV